MLLKVRFLGHEIGYTTIKPIHSKVHAIQKHPTSSGKVALIGFIAALNFYTNVTEKLHINLNLSMTFFTRILLGLGLQNMNIYFQNYKTH